MIPVIGHIVVAVLFIINLIPIVDIPIPTWAGGKPRGFDMTPFLGYYCNGTTIDKDSDGYPKITTNSGDIVTVIKFYPTDKNTYKNKALYVSPNLTLPTDFLILTNNGKYLMMSENYSNEHPDILLKCTGREESDGEFIPIQDQLDDHNKLLGKYKDGVDFDGNPNYLHIVEWGNGGFQYYYESAPSDGKPLQIFDYGLRYMTNDETIYYEMLEDNIMLITYYTRMDDGTYYVEKKALYKEP